MSRPSWHQYFMDIARVTATRSTCDRKHVGCVLVRDNIILSTGYNGSIPGADHCDDVGHMIENDHCVRTQHAEINAIVQAAKHGIAINNCQAYVTATPCWPCFKALVSVGCEFVYIGEEYRTDNKVLEEAARLGIVCSMGY